MVEDNPEGVGHTRNPGVAAVRILGAEAVRILEGVVARILVGVVARIPVEEGLVPDLVDKVGVSPVEKYMYIGNVFRNDREQTPCALQRYPEGQVINSRLKHIEAASQQKLSGTVTTECHWSSEIIFKRSTCYSSVAS